MDLSIVPEHSFCVLRGLGQRPNKHETGGLRVNGIRLFLQSGYRFALLAAFLPPFSTFPNSTILLTKKDGPQAASLNPAFLVRLICFYLQFDIVANALPPFSVER